jgi:hypothetical protein
MKYSVPLNWLYSNPIDAKECQNNGMPGKHAISTSVENKGRKNVLGDFETSFSWIWKRCHENHCTIKKIRKRFVDGVS